MKVRKVIKRVEDFFSFFSSLLFTFENDGNLLWVYQNGNFLPGKSISHREKIRENDFAPSEKYACYAPGSPVLKIFCSLSLMLEYKKTINISHMSRMISTR